MFLLLPPEGAPGDGTAPWNFPITDPLGLKRVILCPIDCLCDGLTLRLWWALPRSAAWRRGWRRARLQQLVNRNPFALPEA
jgi:hypothetical protein